MGSRFVNSRATTGAVTSANALRFPVALRNGQCVSKSNRNAAVAGNEAHAPVAF